MPVRTAALLTREGRQHLQMRCERIREELVELSGLLRDVDRDERHVRDYERLLGELHSLEAELAAAGDLRSRRGMRTSLLGRRVEIVDEMGEAFVVRAVHPLEAPVDDERISWDSPLGRLLATAAVGDELIVDSPRGPWRCRVERVLE